MRQVKAAAVAPADPSSADRSVASKAEAQAIQAQAELASQPGGRPADPQQPDVQGIVNSLALSVAGFG